MRRPHIRLGAALRLTFRLARGQQPDKSHQTVQLALLTGDDIGQIVHSAGQVGDAFFKDKGVHDVENPVEAL